MRDINENDQATLRAIAERHDIDLDAVKILFDALVDGRGVQAQFDHPDLGGMGQWSQGGMIMIGDMFNSGLKAKIGTLCTELSGLARAVAADGSAGSHQSQTQGSGQGARINTAGASRSWWPQDLGRPASTGAQNSLRYAFFPDSHRLAIDTTGQIDVYDTGDHRITGFSQQQSGDQSVTFTSQHGPVRVSDLTSVAAPDEATDGEPDEKMSGIAAGAQTAVATPKPHQPADPKMPTAEQDIIDKIERLSGLHAKGVLTDDEYQTKKTELLARL